MDFFFHTSSWRLEFEASKQVFFKLCKVKLKIFSGYYFPALKGALI